MEGTQSVQSAQKLMWQRKIKLFLVVAVVFSLIFCVARQNVSMFLSERKLEELASRRADLEKSVYLMNVELSSLRSRERMKRIAQEQLNMIPITPGDVRLIVYE